MKINSPLPQDKKLTVVCRVESGCLGPEGEDHVEGFCGFAQKELEPIDSDFIRWEVVPRDNKSQPETQYELDNKTLSPDKVARYLEMFNKNLDDFQEELDERLILLIEQYMKA